MTKTIFALLVATLVGQYSSVFASEYPADYPIRSDYKDNGSVHVRRDLQTGGNIALNIAYDGYLKNSSKVSVYIRFIYDNGNDIREGFFDMQKSRNGYQVRITNGCLVGQLGGCAQRGTETMKHLLKWAARDTGMTLNALKFDVAFVDGDGKWDSQFSKNYDFQFGELSW